MNKILVIDSETTGVDVFRNRMISFSANIYEENDQPNNPRERFNFIFTDYREGYIEPAALKVNKFLLGGGMSVDMTAPKHHQGSTIDFVNQFTDFVNINLTKNDYVLGYNVGFDLMFLRMAFERCNVNGQSLLPHKVIDVFTLVNTFVLAGIFSPVPKYVNAETIYKMYGIVSTGIHAAWKDIEMTFNLWQCMKIQLEKMQTNMIKYNSAEKPQDSLTAQVA